MTDLRLTLATTASLIVAAAPGISHAGYYYEAITSNEAAGTPGGSQASTVHAWVDGDSAKVEFQNAAQAGIFQAGSYLITTDAGETLALVDPEKMTITPIDFEQILGMAGSMMEAMGGVVNMDFSDFSSEKISEEDGGAILGHSTTRSRYQSGYTMTIAVMGFRQESRIDTDNQVWCSDDFDAAGLRVWLRPDRFRTGNEDFDQMIRQQYETMNCLPLRNEVITTTMGNGNTTVTTTTTEVVEIREEDVPASTFELPVGYEEVSLMEGIAEGMQNQGGQEDDSGMPDFRNIFR
jgi:hypothetical protein